MKKTLAILLALIMTASVALVSCNKSEDTEGADDDFVVDFEGGDLNGDTSAVETDENGETKKPTGNNSGASGNLIDVNDTVYTLCSVNLRDTMKIDQSGKNVVATIPAGTAITRVGKGTEWCKVTYGGATGYVVTEFLAMSADAVTFVEPTGVTTDEATGNKTYPTTKIVGSGNYQLRQVPVVDSQGLEIVGQLKGGATVEVLEISKDNKWAKIKATTVGKLGPDGTYNTSTYDQTGTGYILYQYLEMGAGSSSGGNGGEIVGG